MLLPGAKPCGRATYEGKGMSVLLSKREIDANQVEFKIMRQRRSCGGTSLTRRISMWEEGVDRG